MKRLPIFLLLLLLLLFPQTSAALSCAPPDIEKEFERSEAVVIASIEKYITKGPVGGRDLRVDSELQAQISKVFKGSLTGEVAFFSNSYWGNTFVVGEQYLLFLRTHDSKLQSSVCSATKLYSQVTKEELSKLEALSAKSVIDS